MSVARTLEYFIGVGALIVVQGLFTLFCFEIFTKEHSLFLRAFLEALNAYNKENYSSFKPTFAIRELSNIR